MDVVNYPCANPDAGLANVLVKETSGVILLFGINDITVIKVKVKNVFIAVVTSYMYSNMNTGSKTKAVHDKDIITLITAQ